MTDETLFITRPLVPDMAQLTKELETIFASRWLTNSGSSVKHLQQRLKDYLEADSLQLVSSGTSALIVAMLALGLTGRKGEVITTPYTFPATAHVIKLLGLTPVFADICPDRLVLDPKSAEGLITDSTLAIVGVHLFGMPCYVHEFEALAKRYGIALLFDGAHSFGTRVGDRPIHSFGDATAYSFHATKLFHTAEGGAVGCNTEGKAGTLARYANFGIDSEDETSTIGINAKMSELHAALGLLTLDKVAGEVEKRRLIKDQYRSFVKAFDGVNLIEMPADTTCSEQYCAIRIDPAKAGISARDIRDRLRSKNIVARQLFFPLLTESPAYRSEAIAAKGRLVNAQRYAGGVLALPFYGDLLEEGRLDYCLAALASILSAPK